MNNSATSLFVEVHVVNRYENKYAMLINKSHILRITRSGSAPEHPIKSYISMPDCCLNVAETYEQLKEMIK